MYVLGVDDSDNEVGWNSCGKQPASSAAGNCGTASSSAGDGWVTPQEPPEPTYDLCPHEGLLYLDVLGVSHTLLGHKTTLEKVVLPHGSWELVYLDGVGAVQDRTTDEVILVEDILKRTLYTNSFDGHCYVRDSSGQGESYNITTKLRMYKPGTASWHLKDMHKTEVVANDFRVYFPRGSSKTMQHSITCKCV